MRQIVLWRRALVVLLVVAVFGVAVAAVQPGDAALAPPETSAPDGGPGIYQPPPVVPIAPSRPRRAPPTPRPTRFELPPLPTSAADAPPVDRS